MSLLLQIKKLLPTWTRNVLYALIGIGMTVIFHTEITNRLLNLDGTLVWTLTAGFALCAIALGWHLAHRYQKNRTAGKPLGYFSFGIRLFAIQYFGGGIIYTAGLWFLPLESLGQTAGLSTVLLSGLILTLPIDILVSGLSVFIMVKLGNLKPSHVLYRIAILPALLTFGTRIGLLILFFIPLRLSGTGWSLLLLVVKDPGILIALGHTVFLSLCYYLYLVYFRKQLTGKNSPAPL
jgi:hypothetical protein